jgi:hypothetical protein
VGLLLHGTDLQTVLASNLFLSSQMYLPPLNLYYIIILEIMHVSFCGYALTTVLYHTDPFSL